MKNNVITFLVSALVIVMLVIGFSIEMPLVSAAPNAAPTPLGDGLGSGNGKPEYVEWFNAQTITADTTVCRVAENYQKLNIHSFVDITNANTVSMDARFTNKIGLTPVAGPAIQATVTSDTGDIDQVPTFGRYTCIFVDVANATPVAITVNAIGK